MLKKYKPVYFDTNYVTYKYGMKAQTEEKRTEEESKAIYNKNFRNFYPMNDEILTKMAMYSEFPKPLLDKLVTFFPPDDKDLFYERCEQMHQIRLNAINARLQK